MAQAGEGASKISIEEETPRLRQIEGVSTNVAGIVAVTERGPIGLGPVLTAFEDYLRIYGNDIANGEGSHHARGFFKEGGKQLYVVRTVHYSNVDDASTKTSAAATLDLETGATSPTAGSVLGTNVGPFEISHGSTLVITVDAGSPTTATINGTAASRESAAETFAISNGETLTVSVDGGSVQTIAFLTAEFVSIGAATAEEVAAVINAKITGATATVTSAGTKVTITSDRKGTGSGINVTGGSANGVLGFTTGNTAGGGNVSNLAAVTVAEIKTIVELAVSGCTVSNAGGAVRISSNTTGASSSILVGASSTADDELGLDNATHSGTTGAAQPTLTVDAKYDGAYGNDVEIVISDASNDDASYFDMQVLQSGRIVATYPNVTMDSAATRYVENVLNDETSGSQLVSVTDLALSGTATERRPANGTLGPLAGGDDGLSGLVDADFVGSAAGGTGLYALDRVDDLSILINGGRATATFQNEMLSYCETWRNMSVFAVLDPPAGLTAAQMVTYVESTASLLEASEFGAIYWPRVKVLNPNKTVFGSSDQITIAPSGIIAGIYARTDAGQVGGVYQPPAGIKRGRLTSVLGFETDEVLDERKRDLVYPKRINPLTVSTGLPRHIDGSRTLLSTGNFPSVAERRGVIFIEQSIKRGLQAARHDNNTPELRAQCDRITTMFLDIEMRKGAFRSKDPATAFFVDYGDALNPDSEVFAGKLYGRVGLATNKPAEFFVIRFTQDTRALEAELAG